MLLKIEEHDFNIMKFEIDYNKSISQEAFVAITENHSMYTTSVDISNKTGKRHDNVMRDIESIMNNDKTGTVKDYFIPGTYTDGRNNTQRMYKITYEGTFIYFGRLTGATGQYWQTRYALAFRNAQEKLRSILNEVAAMPNPGSVEYFAQALLYANDAMANYKKQIEDARFEIETQAAQIEVQVQQIQSQTNQIQQMQPYVELGRAVGECAEGVLVKTLAAYITQYARKNGFPDFCIGGNNMMKWLRVNKYVYLSHKTNIPMQRYIDAGYFTIDTTVVTKKIPHQKLTTHVTGKGQQYFLNKFMEQLNGGHDIITELRAVKE